MAEYNPNDISVPNGNYFSMPFSPENSSIVLLSVPWDVTTSYKPGTANAPEAILEASAQLDMFDFNNPDGWKKGIGTIEFDYSILERSKKLRIDAEKIIIHLESGGSLKETYARKKLERINSVSEELNRYIYSESLKWLRRGKKVGLVGGDHSTPYGYIKAASEYYGNFGILHIDAHADLRNAYEGFEYSHASIMYNVIEKIENIDKLVQVAVRDICEDEINFIRKNQKIRTFFDKELYDNKFTGITWDKQCEDIISCLPEKVYVSFDIDGLSPEYSPGTGTPVPGGISFNEAIFMLNKLTETGREIIGFDLCEVATDFAGEWDANVGARVLYKLCNLSLKKC
ncbi:MAG: agmatinase family protein [Rikenellaceae bacterium]|nr:agmatinase family protein [Rikenellaceae bacterium]